MSVDTLRSLLEDPYVQSHAGVKTIIEQLTANYGNTTYGAMLKTALIEVKDQHVLSVLRQLEKGTIVDESA